MPRKKIVEIIEEVTGALCEHCFPGGWDSLPDDVQSTGCAHGVWKPDAVPADGAAPETPSPPVSETATPGPVPTVENTTT